MQMIGLPNAYSKIMYAKSQAKRELLSNIHFGKTYDEFLIDLEIIVKTKLVFDGNFLLTGYQCGEDHEHRTMTINLASRYVSIDADFAGLLKLIPGVEMQYDDVMNIAKTMHFASVAHRSFDLVVRIDLEKMPADFECNVKKRFDAIVQCQEAF